MTSRKFSIFSLRNDVGATPVPVAQNLLVTRWHCIGVIFFVGWLSEWRNLQTHAVTTSDTSIDIVNDESSVCPLPSTIFPYVTTSHDSTTFQFNTCPNPHGSGKDTSIPEEISSTATKTRSIGQLRPSNLPPPEIFTDFNQASLIKVPGKNEPQIIHHGTVRQINQIRNKNSVNATLGTSDITYLPQLMNIEDVGTVVELLRNFQHYDEDPDTVDGMKTHEIFVDSPEVRNMMHQYLQRHHQDQSNAFLEPTAMKSMKLRDYDLETLPERILLRSQLQSILQPILTERITPFVQAQYPHLCNRKNKSNISVSDTDDRFCTPCFSLIRRYRYGERQSHGTHYDGHALITVVISLSNYSTDFNGGLYVSTGYGQRQFVPLYSGDAIAHQSTLLHGVQVLPIVNNMSATERWSWILWYRDSTNCIDYSYEWFVDCAKKGDAVCQELYATKIGNIPISKRDDDIDDNIHAQARQNRVMESIVHWNRASAEQGNGNAAIKMARAYLKLLPSTLSFNQTEAIRYYKLAMASQHPDGYYGMANLYVESLHKKKPLADVKHRNSVLSRVVQLLEEAAIRGHVYAMFNLGIAHCYGYGIHQIDTDLAALWFIQSGLPEGYYAAAHQAASMGNVSRQKQLDDMARKLGYYEQWRTEARERTGSGGASGVNLNMKWPVSVDGRLPPNF